jgi:Tol biopolymer transport system component
MDADGSNQTRISTDATGTDCDPAWSPDGTKIAFESFRDGNDEIDVMNPDGTEQTCLTNNSVSDSASAWSPDGAKIAFVSERDGNAEIYVMNADGSDQTRLTNNSAIDRHPALSAGQMAAAAQAGLIGVAGLIAVGFFWSLRRTTENEQT